jgi:hypothetical protein
MAETGINELVVKLKTLQKAGFFSVGHRKNDRRIMKLVLCQMFLIKGISFS